MSEHNPQILSYVHLGTYPRAADALHALKKISSLVKPIMRKRSWTLPTLAEFFPAQQNLLGININRGQKICLRLRYAGDNTQFMPLEQVVDTMLHELSHNVHGPHDAVFHALWNELRDEYQDLVMKGYTGEGFVGQGSRLGGRNIPMREMRRQARVSAERRKMLSSGSGRKLGGAPVMRNTDMRQVIADAAARRLIITQGCASNTKQGDEIADREARNGGFRTKADEADANERAIAEALWELVQEDEARKAGLPADAWKTGNLTFNPNTGFDEQPQADVVPVPHVSISPVPHPSKPSISQTRCDLPSRENAHQSTTNPPPGKPISSGRASWACSICTLVNPSTFLVCDACGIERPSAPAALSSTTPSPNPFSTNKPRSAPPPAAAAASSKRKLSHSDLTAPKKLGWNCRRCGAFMEHKWWTCSACGLMKDSSG